MNEEEQLGGTLPELTEEERQRLLIEQEQSQQAIDELSQTEQAATAAQPSNQPKGVDKWGWHREPAKIGELDIGADMGAIAADPQTSIEYALAVPTSVVDAGVGLLNLIPNVNIPKIPEFEDEVTQSVREISSIILPTLYLGGKGTASIAANTKNVKLLADPAVKFYGEALFKAGVGAVVDYSADFNQKDDNLAGSLKKSFPKWMGWIPDNVATLDSDSPDVKRAKNVVEGVALGIGADLIIGLSKFVANLSGLRKATAIVPESEKAKNMFKDSIEIDNTVEEAVDRSAGKRATEMDEVGDYNFNKSTDPNEPIFGHHALYGHQEEGIRSVDDLGIIGASVDYARISLNIDSTYGRVGSVMSEGALKFANESSENGFAVIRGLAETLKDADAYGYKTASGKYLSFEQIKTEGDKLADMFYEMDLGELQRTIRPGTLYQGTNVSTKTPELTDEAYSGVMGAISKYMDDFLNMDEVKATAYVGTSFGGQISDMSQGVRLVEGTAATQRAQEMVLDRVEFLMAQKGMTSYVRGRALNMLNLNPWKRMTVKGSKAYDLAEAKRLENLINNEGNTTLSALERIKQESTETVANLKRINEENPRMLAPLMMAYELTDGNIKTITALNKYVNESTGVLSKAFFDGNPQIPSVIIQGFYANLYNSTLSAFSTPIKAGISAGHLLVEKPLRTFAGALFTKDWATMERGLYQYRNITGALNSSFDYMNQIFKRSGTDPNVIKTRDDLGLKNTKQVEILNTFADAKAAEGDFGPQYLMQQVNDMQALAEHPWLRFGTRSMQGFDGFTQSMIAHVETRGRIFDELTEGGAKRFNKIDADKLTDEAYKAVFDEKGIIRDKAVERIAGEISLNLDNPANSALSDVIRKMPILKPFLLFTKTPLNELALTASYNPIGLTANLPLVGKFTKRLNQFNLPFDEMPTLKVQELLTSRGIEVTPYNARAKYNELRADYYGRKAIGTLVTGSGVALFMDDRLHGNGHYNRQKQKLRRQVGWKPRSIKGVDGKWHSYDGLGPLTNWLALTADIMDNFDSLSPDAIGENLKKVSFILAASITDKTMLSGIQPFLDVVRGDVGAMNKWGASFISAGTIKGSSQFAELSRLMDPELKEVGDNILDLSINRLPGLKSTLPSEYDWIDGGEVGIPDNFFARIRNTYTPWKESGSISAEKQFLIDIEYDATPTLRTNGQGSELTNVARSEVTNIMGQRGYFKKGIQRVMQSIDGNEFRDRFKEARRANTKPDLSKFENIHNLLDFELRHAMKQAIAQSPSRTSIMKKQYVNEVVQGYLQRGQQDKAQDFINSVRATN